MILEYRARNVAEILGAVRKCSKEWAPRPSDPEELWFRGEGAKYSLLPGLYRSESLALRYDEENLQERFKAKGMQFVPGSGGTAWDWYVRAQHYGIPTRLLDWTDSLIAATYFATAAHINLSDRRPFDLAREVPRRKAIFDPNSPVVWVLDAGSLNRFAYGYQYDQVFALGGPGTDFYLTDAITKRHHRRNRYPIAILPPHTNDRIIAQQGSFTIHGHEKVSLDDLASRPESMIRLARVVIDRTNAAHLWRELEYLGVTQASLFPGLESLATVTKWFGQSSAGANTRRSTVAKGKGGPKKRAKKAKPKRGG
jgi:FRG domain